MMKRKRFHKVQAFRLRSAQAIAEMAIFGSIILMILSTLLSYMQRMNDQQYLLQESFRQALKKAHDAYGGQGSSVSYTIFDNKRNTSIFSPLKGDRGQLNASSVVYWAIPKAGSSNENQTWYRFNEDEAQISKSVSENTEDIDTEVSANYRDDSTIAETAGSVSVYQGTSMEETITYTLKDDSGSALYTVIQGLGDDGKYSTANLNVRYVKSRKWTTPK